MRLVYLIGPYRGSQNTPWARQVNVMNAMYRARDLMAEGLAVIVPQAMYDRIDDDTVGNDEILASCIDVMVRCDAAVVLRNWESSEGSVEEVTACRERGLPVFMWKDYPTPSILALAITTRLDNEDRKRRSEAS